MMRSYFLILSIFLTGCTRDQVLDFTGSDSFVVSSRFASSGLAPLPGEIKVTSGDQFGEYEYQFIETTKSLWGDNHVNTPNVFVKYTNGYRNRTLIDFEKKIITVSTINSVNPEGHLVNAVSTILLAPLSPEKVDIYSDRSIDLGGQPFLYGRVTDFDGKSIKWQWRARKFAKSLVASELSKEIVNFRKAYSVTFRFDENQVLDKSYKYKDIVLAASKKYGISEDLIYAIIKTESSFNPFAVSYVGAYGLMQVVPRTAGADVYRLIKKKTGKPTKAILFDPKSNIDIGTAYLSILKNRYLKGISDKDSLRYAMISAYNGGSGGVFRAFGTKNPSVAKSKINELSSQSVYNVLRYDHPFKEARGYIHKVEKYRLKEIH